jgi:integrase
MSLKKLRGETYYADFRDSRGRRKRISLQTSNIRAAQLKYADIIAKRNALNERHIVEIDWKTFKEKLAVFMQAERAANTITWTKLAIKHLEEVRMPRALSDVTPMLLQKVKENMIINGFSKYNVNRCMQALKAIMRLGEKWQLIPKQDWNIIEKLKTPQGRIVFHTNEEIGKLLAACPSDDWKLVILLGADAGLRRGEIAQLKWIDIDFNNEQIYVAPDKTERHRFVPMSRNLRKALERAYKGHKTEFVINVGWGNGEKRNTKDFLTAYYKQISKKAKVPSFLHKLRHTFASQLVQNGVNLYTVSKLLGHSSVQMTEIYAHLVPENFKQAVVDLPIRDNA